MQGKTCGVIVAGIVVAGSTSAYADVIGFEDFDGGAINLMSTVNVFDYGAGGGAGGDVFGRVSPWNGGLGTGGPFDVWDDSVVDSSGGGVFPGDSRGLAGKGATAFFAMNDMDGAEMPNILPDATWSFDISSALSITDITMDIAAMGDFEAASLDGFLVEAQIDGGGYVPIFAGITDEDGVQAYRFMDDGTVPVDTNDPLELHIDGVATGQYLDRGGTGTGVFDSYTSLALAGQSGSTLDIRVSWAGTPSGSEPMGLDNFTINGVIPAPGALALLGVAGLAARRRRR